MLERTCYSNGSEFREYLTLVSQDKRLHQGHTVRNSLLRGKEGTSKNTVGKWAEEKATKH